MGTNEIAATSPVLRAPGEPVILARPPAAVGTRPEKLDRFEVEDFASCGPGEPSPIPIFPGNSQVHSRPIPMR